MVGTAFIRMKGIRNCKIGMSEAPTLRLEAEMIGDKACNPEPEITEKRGVP